MSAVTWLLFAGFTALFESLKDLQSKRTVPFVDIYLVSWSLFALMLPVLAGCWITHHIPVLGSQFGLALMIGGVLNAIAVLLYVEALSSSDLSLTVPLLTLSPLFLLITSPWLVGEYPSFADAAGVLLILMGSYVLNLKEKQHGYLAPFRAILRERGPRLMLVVAFIWSVTANFDKIGVLNSTPAFWVISLFSFIAILLLPIIALKSKQPFKQLQSHYPSLLLIGGLCSLTVLLQMQAIQMGTVTRVIAIKRMSTLLGVFWGYVVFKEKGIQERFMGAVLMVLGVFVIMFG
jgi:uncharacterized membrane protein